MANGSRDREDEDFDQALAALAEALRALRIEQGHPSYRRISRRAPVGRPLSVTGIGSVMAGEYLPSIDFLVALVRTLLAFDTERGPLPSLSDPRLAEWKSRWGRLKVLQDRGKLDGKTSVVNRRDAVAGTTVTGSPTAERNLPAGEGNTGSADEPASDEAGTSHPGPAEIASLRQVVALRGMAARVVLSALGRGEYFDLEPLFGHTGGSVGVSFSPDGRLLLTTGVDGTVRVWDPIAHELITSHDWRARGISRVAFSPDGRLLVATSGDGGLRLWDPVSDAITFIGDSLDIIGIAFCPDNRHFATVASSGEVLLWDTLVGDVLSHYIGRSGGSGVVAFSSDGQLLATTGPDDELVLWDPFAKEVTAALASHPGGSTGLAFSSDGKHLAATGANGTVRLWETGTHRPVAAHRHHTGHPGGSTGLAFSPDGRLLATTGADGTVRLWEAVSRRPATVFTGHRGSSTGVAFSPDGQLLATTGADGSVRLWITPLG
ncbi:hypothetical protein GCM10010302_31680 [Streptomyces polychromogenes]|uniref:Uncharacterized protein n=1 Tax=Streptomyces polychromogenes TaxID=67342 RepID=A0ABP3F552_9ACTN